MEQRKFYRIRNWRKYQHYKYRNPPWVKLHLKILHSADWVNATPSCKLSMICCLLIGTMYDGCVPDDSVMIKRVCHIDWRVDFKPLLKSGFLENMLADASTMLAKADPETETEKKDAANAALNGHQFGRLQPSGEAELFGRGKQVLGKNAGGLIRKLLTAKRGNVALARAAIEQASTKENPREYIGRIIAGPAIDVEHGYRRPPIEGIT
jgi:hypothetical protein